MTKPIRNSGLCVLVAIAIVGVGFTISGNGITTPEATASPAVTTAPAPDDPALERARREVRLLDDIYKTSIVLITTHYVNGDEDLAAGSAFKALFEAVEKKGWHQVRLIDATGEPYNEDNAPREGFEQRAIAKLLEGKPAFEEVEQDGDRRYLRVATAIPVVMDKCIMCHDNYDGLPAGKAIGAVGYRVPILSDADLISQ